MTERQQDPADAATETVRPLAAYRVIELPGAASLPAGKAFADLGAEVIKVEPPHGDPARRLPPFAHAEDGATISLYWAAYRLGTRSVTADLASETGRETVRRLAATADVVIESYPPGALERSGLGYQRLHDINPRLVLTSISSFGQSGPYAAWQGSDLVHLAMSGYLNMTGPKDGTPIKPSAPYQTWLHGSMHAVAATMLALRRRRQTGIGSHVDLAMRDTGMWMLTHTYQFWDLLGVNLRRQGSQRDMGGVLRLPTVYRCADGYVVWLFQTGHIGGRTTRMLVEWMAAEDMAPAWLLEQDWMTFDLLAAGAEMTARLAAAFAAFFARKPKSELFEWALARGIMLAPVQTLRDLTDDVQLDARQAWRTLLLGEGLPVARVPGPPIRLGEGAWEPRGTPPSLGEHTHDFDSPARAHAGEEKIGSSDASDKG